MRKKLKKAGSKTRGACFLKILELLVLGQSRIFKTGITNQEFKASLFISFSCLITLKASVLLN